MTFPAYPLINTVPGLDLCANDNQNPPVLVLLSRGFNSGIPNPPTATPPTVPDAQNAGCSVPTPTTSPSVTATEGSPVAQLLATNQQLGTAYQVTELSAVGIGLQRMNTPQLTSTVL